jgi:hypothetical protein
MMNGVGSKPLKFSAATSRRLKLLQRGVKCGGNRTQKLKGRRKKAGGEESQTFRRKK